VLCVVAATTAACTIESPSDFVQLLLLKDKGPLCALVVSFVFICRSIGDIKNVIVLCDLGKFE
jgi:hypothetical protein